MRWEESPPSVLGEKAEEKGQNKSEQKGELKEMARWGAVLRLERPRMMWLEDGRQLSSSATLTAHRF